MSDEQHNAAICCPNKRDRLCERCESLRKAYEVFLKQLTPEVANRLYLNDVLLELVVGSYFDDIDRYKGYSGTPRADHHKQAAYTIKWIAKIKPIQIIPVEIHENTDTLLSLLDVNSSFALYAGIRFLHGDIFPLLSPNFFQHLLYILRYRHISGKSLAVDMFMLEKIVEAYNWDHKSEKKFEI